MKQLADILAGLDCKLIKGSTGVNVSSIAFDSRAVKKGGLFCAVRGTRVDGHQFIPDAIQNGAKIIVFESSPGELDNECTWVQLNNTAEGIAIIAHNFYDRPSEELALIGITGTNGKTTTATLLHNLYQIMGKAAGLLSTNGVRIGNEEKPATHTTPDPIQVTQYLREMVDQKISYAFMEVSSHALAQERIAGLQFTGAVFTNITHEHLDYHLTFDNYLKAKKRLFDLLPKDAFALVNGDDKQGKIMVQNCKASTKTFALKQMADYKARILENDLTGMRMEINGLEVYSPITGRFNAYNLLGVYGVAMELYANDTEVLQAISRLQPIDGRLDMVQNKKGVTGIVDYAHSPDALENVLTTIKESNQHGGQVFTIIGCGGDRDREKRPDMASIAVKYSDKVILTSDNPRFENPETIIQEMERGVHEEEKHKVLAITKRDQAIQTATHLSQKGDIVLVAGKGHEKYQEVEGEKRAFDDKALLNAYLKSNEDNTTKDPV